VLSVDIAEQGRELAQQRNRHGAAAEEGAGLSARQDLALDQQLAILDGDARGIQQGAHVGAVTHVEDARHARARLAGADHFGRSAGAQQQAEGIHHDGLAAARLARQQIQARMEAHPDAIDHGVVFDQQLHKHSVPIITVALRTRGVLLCDGRQGYG
jgi:hypothetical protein